MKYDFTIPVPIQKWTIEKNSDGGEYVFVEGYATTDKLDSQGEKISKAAVEKALPDWKGNIREMHQPSAVGKAVSMEMDDKGLWVRSKIVDPAAVTKVKEGIYTAYSLGGKRIAKEGDTITALKIIETSLVDVGANPDCDFTIAKLGDDGKIVDVQKFEGSGDVKKLEAKFDGAVEMLSKALAAVLEKKESSKGGYLVTEDDGTQHLPTETDGKPDHTLMGAAWAALHGGYRGNKYEGPDKAKALSKLKAKYKSEGMKTPDEKDDDTEKIAKALGLESPDLVKDLYTVGDVAMVIQSLDRMVANLKNEADVEGDDSDMPAALAEIRDELGDLLIELATEEVKEIAEGKDWRSAGQYPGYSLYGW